ncbi:Hypothetical Protein FCC1311_098402 [Hondaea fermentalgiana]|uniref:Uncharacterized protein n=1 Tax=Hondaea fermentalgiana TaxID=2315210 RepID=A0A2R5GRV9_9STRA|nr:Hypothetical Protein FCC1311_098402 [Hondaea fermentalgiana]|eukprot:GBG33617.1 Hypothetical Protein FCC1311_098402 [Hondaea fermentalgiana]
MSTIVTSVSSSSTQIVQATPAPSAFNALLDEVLKEVADLHEIDDMEGLRKLATVYFESADKEGFIFNFDEVWPHAGYARKDKAKRAIVGDRGRGGNAGGLRRDIDVQISVKPSPPSSGASSSRGQHGGQNREQILLTHRRFSHFCYSARTLQSMMVRDFVISLVKGVRKLQKAPDAGEMALVRREHRRQPVPLQLEASARERIKTCELTKAVSAKLCAPGKRMGPLIPFVHAPINEMKR